MNFLISYGPALAFLGAYFHSGIYFATGVLIASLFGVVLLHWLWKRELHKMHLGIAVVAGVLGGLTLYLRDPLFIQYKPSAVYAVFALVLVGSHFVGDKVLLARLGGQTLTMPDAVWRRINLAWAAFFVVCALLNIYVAWHYSEAAWVQFKTFGFPLLMFAFILAHLPFVSRYLPKE